MPESRTSSRASSSACAPIASAHARITAARSKPVAAPHSPSKARRAAATAVSTSAGVPSATRAHGRPAYGSSESNSRRDSDSIDRPSMNKLKLASCVSGTTPDGTCSITASTVVGMTDVASVRLALLELHRRLLETQRIQAERFGGRMTATELLQAAADDLRFSWLKQLSELIAELDQARADEDDAAVEAAVARARALLAPPDPDTPFGARYLRALQDQPEVVLAHRDVTAALG